MESRTAGENVRAVQSDHQQNNELRHRKEPLHRPELRTIQAIAQALELTLEQRRELFYTAFPEFYVWDEAAEHGYTVDETNDLLHGRGLPLLTSDK